MSLAPLNLLCAGAAQGLVRALLVRFEADTGAEVHARFGAVGAMRAALVDGEPCDLMVVTDAMVVNLQAEGLLDSTERAPLGRVSTGIAVRADASHPPIASADELRASLLAARSIYFPDPQRATAGIHFESVMRQLGVLDALAARLKTFPNGATSMRELAADPHPGALGCTQVTEILYAPGIALVGALPAGLGLATVYSAAVARNAAQPKLARHLMALLTGPSTRELRVQGGFELDDR